MPLALSVMKVAKHHLQNILKCHITTKHKHIVKSLGKSRDFILDDSLRLGNNYEEIRDTIDISVYEELTVKICNNCDDLCCCYLRIIV